MVTMSRTSIVKPNSKYALLVTNNSDVEPPCFSQVVKQAAWRKAMGAEFDALQLNGTWSLVPARPRVKILPNKWVFKIKWRPDGSINRYKARLVVNGFH